jgi:hypothetical protein
MGEDMPPRAIAVRVSARATQEEAVIPAVTIAADITTIDSTRISPECSTLATPF